MKSFVALAVLLASVVTAEHAPLGIRAHRRNLNPDVLKRMDQLLDRREPLPQVGGIDIPGLDPNPTPSASASQSSSISSPDPTSTSSSTSRPPVQEPDTTTSSSTSTTSTSTSTSQPSTSSITSTSTSTSSTSTVNANTQPTVITRTSQDAYTGINLSTARLTTVRPSTTSSEESQPTEAETGGSIPFSQNKAAVAATATVAALVALGALFFIGFWWKKKSQRGKMSEEDMWDEASMKEFSRPAGTPIVAPPPVVMRNVDLDSEMGDPSVGAAGLGRTNTKVLPSQAALARSRSTHQHEHVYEEDPDTLLAMPPVAHYDRPRDSAYDIVPAAPPAAAYAQQGGGAAGYGYSNAYASGSSGAAGPSASGSGGLQPPIRKGDHTSFGSGIGNDPFAGSGFVDASRESTFGPGQAGRGAGYSAQNGQPMQQGQWDPGYNPYTGYSQGAHGAQQGYGGGYGYAN